MLKIRWIVLTGILTYLIFLVVTFPVHVLIKQFPEVKQMGPVSIKSASGTVWNGRADAQVLVEKVRVDLDVAWAFAPTQLLLGRLGLNLDIASQGALQGLDVQALAAVSPSLISVNDLSGIVRADFVNGIAKSHGAEISGDINFNQLSVLLNHKTKHAKEASGTVTWPGGDVVGGGQRFSPPPLIGSLSMQEETMRFDLLDQGMNKVYAEAEYPPTGWARVAVKKRIMELAGQTVDKRKATQSVFELKQKLF